MQRTTKYIKHGGTVDYLLLTWSAATFYILALCATSSWSAHTNNLLTDKEMGRIKCKCGHLIVDTSTQLAYHAGILPDQSFDLAFDRINQVIESLIEATNNKKRQEWVNNQFGGEYPKDLTDAQMIGDIFETRLQDIIREIYQCENCGRILIANTNSNRYISFMPEDDDWKNILTK